MAFLKSMWKVNSKHKKLSEELAIALQNNKEVDAEQVQVVENENDVVTFKLKYLGSTVVESITGDNISTESVKNIVKTAKAKGRKKMQRVNVAISLKGIAVTDLQGNDILKISIYRISNCSTDATHKQIFSFIATDENETMECHAFVCSKRKMAETVTLTVAQAFSTAYEAWREMPPSSKTFQENTIKSLAGNEKNNVNRQNASSDGDGSGSDSSTENEEQLIDFDNDPYVEDDSFDFGRPPCQNNVNSRWVCFEDDFVSEGARMPQKIDLILA